MKVCAICGAIAAAAEPTCARCGEASWIASADDRNEPPLPEGAIVGTVDSPTEVLIPARHAARKGRR